jgi:type I restriction enzyme R subunit
MWRLGEVDGVDAWCVKSSQMKTHTLMQTIARANRVFGDKQNGLIVDYIGDFRNLEKALAIYGVGGTEDDTPVKDKV